MKPKPQKQPSVSVDNYGRVYSKGWFLKKKDGTKEWYDSPSLWIEYRFHGKVHPESAHTNNLDEAIKYLRSKVDALNKGRAGIHEDRIKFSDLRDMIIRDYKINGKRSLRSLLLSIRHLEVFFAGYKA